MSLPKWIQEAKDDVGPNRWTAALEIAWEALRWTAQTVHQGHHIDEKGTWETCEKGICPSVRFEMRRIKELGK